MTTNDINNAIEQTLPLAPAGHRDLWKAGSTNGSYVFYFESSNMLYCTNPYVGSNNYSTDGGITYSPISYFPPVTHYLTIGYNGSVYVALPTDPLDGIFTSTDGINFTYSGTYMSDIFCSYNIIWFAK